MNLNIKMTGFDGSQITTLGYLKETDVQLSNHTFMLEFCVASIGVYEAVFGMRFITSYMVDIFLSRNNLTLSDQILLYLLFVKTFPERD